MAVCVVCGEEVDIFGYKIHRWLMFNKKNDGVHVEKYNPDHNARNYLSEDTGMKWIGICPNCQKLKTYIIHGKYRLTIQAIDEQDARDMFEGGEYVFTEIEIDEDYYIYEE